MKDRVKIGSKVKISEDSDYYGEHVKYNPADETGEVTGIEDVGFIEVYVKWNNGYTNSYCVNDLDIV